MKYSKIQNKQGRVDRVFFVSDRIKKNSVQFKSNQFIVAITYMTAMSISIRFSTKCYENISNTTERELQCNRLTYELRFLLSIRLIKPLLKGLLEFHGHFQVLFYYIMKTMIFVQNLETRRVLLLQ